MRIGGRQMTHLIGQSATSIYIYISYEIPVVPHKAVAEVSRIGNV